MINLSQFKNQPFLSIETKRKDGTAVPTPVWFVQDGDVLYVRTIDGSGKVKRARNFSAVRVMPGSRPARGRSPAAPSVPTSRRSAGPAAERSAAALI